MSPQPMRVEVVIVDPQEIRVVGTGRDENLAWVAAEARGGEYRSKLHQRGYRAHRGPFVLVREEEWAECIEEAWREGYDKGRQHEIMDVYAPSSAWERSQARAALQPKEEQP